MNTQYTTVISIRSLQGMQEIGTFFLGTEADFANSVFDSLKGDLTSKNDVLIRVDLEKKEEGILPVRMKSISCTLNQYAENCKIITRDIFKYFTLEK
jgi:hypothetical protein